MADIKGMRVETVSFPDESGVDTEHTCFWVDVGDREYGIELKHPMNTDDLISALRAMIYDIKSFD